MTTDRQQIAKEVEEFLFEYGKPLRILDGDHKTQIVNFAADFAIRALEQSEGWVKVSELVRAAEARVKHDQLTVREFNASFASVQAAYEASEKLSNELAAALTAYKAALPSPPTSEETA